MKERQHPSQPQPQPQNECGGLWEGYGPQFAEPVVELPPPMTKPILDIDWGWCGVFNPTVVGQEVS
jgi:hypothetical protein